ncbi:hypothetical protein GZ212_03290 [Mangrovimonas sp. CR14]|uniref:hypothetical protein n=1 Tax=Mangrovimonas sp. CR14 TaxID=2706120 RepID=UPI0014205885|nr:hypothetical protein [Mangrovimonas sp. CR14]NIK91166.1 hypothetical protein [Mangrovimonas sp. CR14]
MDKTEASRLVEYYEDRIIYNFEKYFNELVLDDFYGGGFRDRIEDSFFYDEYYEQFEEEIIELLLKIKNIDNSEFEDLRLRLIKLKRIIDTKLIEIGKSPSQNKPVRESRIGYFMIKDNINSKELISVLYEELKSKKLVECSKEDFESLFKVTKQGNKIQWKGTERQITYLICSLLAYFDNEIGSRHFKLIESLFTNKSGKTFKSKQLSSVYHEKADSIPPNDKIVKIVNNISTHFPLT